MGFTKLDEGILQSSIMAESAKTFKVWIALLASCKENGISQASSVFLASACHLSLKDIDNAIAVLEAPDDRSRSLEDGGRRIKRVDGGYYIVNYKKYREYSYSENSEAKRKRDYRHGERKRHNGYVYFAGTQTRIKIGFSANPWARISELKIAVPELELLAVYEGTTDDEKLEQKRFMPFHCDREWFNRTPELESYVRDILGRSRTSEGHSASASASAYASVIEILNLKTGKNFSTKPTAAGRHLLARIAEGKTIEQFQYVIDIKSSQWLSDPAMNQYLRPETLFGSKMESYLNERQIAAPVDKEKRVGSAAGFAFTPEQEKRIPTIKSEYAEKIRNWRKKNGLKDDAEIDLMQVPTETAYIRQRLAEGGAS
jgi:uncharacterized phage protein (TIGR02220 family)